MYSPDCFVDDWKIDTYPCVLCGNLDVLKGRLMKEAMTTINPRPNTFQHLPSLFEGKEGPEGLNC